MSATRYEVRVLPFRGMYRWEVVDSRTGGVVTFNVAPSEYRAKKDASDWITARLAKRKEAGARRLAERVLGGSNNGPR